MLADAYRDIVATKLAMVHPVVEQPQPNIIRLRLALTNVYLKKRGGVLAWIALERTYHKGRFR